MELFVPLPGDDYTHDGDRIVLVSFLLLHDSSLSGGFEDTGKAWSMPNT